jgi:hypothetical protein
MIVAHVAVQGFPQVVFTEDNYMVQTISTYGADEPFRERILPRTVWCRWHFGDAHGFHGFAEALTVYLVSVADEVGWNRVLGESFHHLSRRPFGVGMFSHVEVEDAPPMVGQD